MFRSKACEDLKADRDGKIPASIVAKALAELVDGVSQGDTISDLSAWHNKIEELEK